MKNKNGTSRNGLFFLLGVLVYSFLFWLTDKNYVHVFGTILVGLICYLNYLVSLASREQPKFIKPQDVIYFSIGAVFDSFSNGFPFNIWGN